MEAGQALGDTIAAKRRTREGSRMPKLRIRIEFAGRHTLGPGKIQLLEAVAEHGSISAAARSMHMSYRHAWEMLDDINQCFREPAISTETGGRDGGGATVTEFGRGLIASYRTIQAKARAAIDGELADLAGDCRKVDSAG